MINHFVNSCLSLKTYPINKTELNELKVKSTIVISTYNKLKWGRGRGRERERREGKKEKKQKNKKINKKKIQSEYKK